MLYAGLDLGGRESHLFVVDGKGKRVLSTRVRTTRESLARVFQPLSEAGVSVALETGGVTRWVYKHLFWECHEFCVYIVYVFCFSQEK